MTNSGARISLAGDARWIAGGFLLMMGSGFGQTYFIALHAGELKAAFSLSESAFSGLYTLGTLASAATIIWLGKLADTLPIRWLGLGVIAGLATAALSMSFVSSAIMLGFVFYGLRLFGQGMMTHVALTAMGRWFSKKRGRAVSLAVMGLSAAEASFPPMAVLVLGWAGDWRLSWQIYAIVLVMFYAPLFILCVKRERVPSDDPPAEPHEPASTQRQWRRDEVFKNPLFYALLPGVLAPPVIMTGIFFNQTNLVALKGWDLGWFAGTFWIMSATFVITTFATGWVIDKVHSRAVLPFFLAPLGLGCALLALADQPVTLFAVMALIGMTGGSATTLFGALWPELYGVLHLGSIRAGLSSLMVFSTAAAPFVMGLLLDAGVPLTHQLWAMAAYCGVATLGMAALVGPLNRQAARN